MIYIVINMLGIILGGFFSKYINIFASEKEVGYMSLGANVVIVIVGIQGALTTENSLLMLVSMVIGGVVGAKIDVDDKFKQIGVFLRRKMKSDDNRIAESIISMFMIQAVGSMAIIGPLNAGLNGDGQVLIFKTILDTTVSLIYGAVYGRSVMISGILVFIYQSIIFLFARLISPVLTDMVILEIGAIGSVLIMMLGIDLLDIKKIKVANFLPAILGPIILLLVQGLLNF